MKLNKSDAFIILKTLLYKQLFGLQTCHQVQSVKINIVLKNLCRLWTLNLAEGVNETFQKAIAI